MILLAVLPSPRYYRADWSIRRNRAVKVRTTVRAKKGCLFDHKEKVLLADRNDNTIRLGNRGGASRCLVDQDHFAKESVGSNDLHRLTMDF
jgi:hypothetical protein